MIEQPEAAYHLTNNLATNPEYMLIANCITTDFQIIDMLVGLYYLQITKYQLLQVVAIEKYLQKVNLSIIMRWCLLSLIHRIESIEFVMDLKMIKSIFTSPEVTEKHRMH